ncbi:uncharacterized protein [Rutidosis leptorrhynchoides]|uniref:uncharacterized protein isoform X2 n=1 Tax=Rutidosis leptorrhynchoides TaxID=125765 RepID=UPI003A98FB98
MILKHVLLFIFTFLYIFYDNWVQTPSCDVVPSSNNQEIENEQMDVNLNVMMVADLLLPGRDSRSGYLDLHFKDYYFTRFFQKSYELLKPDMLILLGDVSAQGAKLSQSKWSTVVQQFHSLLGPFLDLPYHVVPGDRDVGECDSLNEILVNKITRSFPGLDSAGCGAFDIGNVNFVSLNTVALLCENNELRFSVEKALERERVELQMDNEHTNNMMMESSGITIPRHDLNWRENDMSSGSGPVLLLHIPLHQTVDRVHDGTVENTLGIAEPFENRPLVGTGPYELLQTLPQNATEYIFHVLKPRIVFSAHTQTFSDRTHVDGTREIVVPAMSWDDGKDPAFVFVTFRKNGTSVIVSHCKLAGRSHLRAV